MHWTSQVKEVDGPTRIVKHERLQQATQDSRAKIVQILPLLERRKWPLDLKRGETIEVDEDDEVVKYDREEYLRVVKLAQERKVVRTGLTIM